jgi:hypothetical protein
MKYIITESQFKNRIYDKFLNMLVRETKIFGIKKHKYMKYDYVAFIKYPFSEKIPSDLAFNDPEEYTFTTPGGLMGEWLKLIGINMEESMELGYELWKKYNDMLEDKIKDYIKNFLD